MRKVVYNMIQDALLLALLIVFTLIRFPLGAIQFTMQLFIIFIIGLICNVKDSLLVVGLYLILGLVGLPIFSNGGGIYYVYQPSFGFMIGFVILCPCIRLIQKGFNKLKLNPYLSNIIATLIGLVIDYFCGVIYAYFIFNYHLHAGYNFFKVFGLVIVPFIIFDLIKCVIAAIVSKKLSDVLTILNNQS